MIDSLPYGWEVVQIEQVADLINGYSQFNSKSYVDKGIPIFRIGDLGGQVHLSSVKRVSEAFVPNLNQKRLFRGDILIAKIGNRVGTSSVYNFDEPAILSSQVAGVRARRIDQKFLACFIESSFFYDAIKPHFFGSTRDNISPNHIRLTPIPFPPFPIQRKIAAVLSAYDDLIENNTRRIKILEEMASVIYREWFVEFRFPGHEQVEMVESGLIPQGWEVVRTEQIIKRVQSGKKYNQKTAEQAGNIPVLDQGQSGIIGYHNDVPGVIASEDEPIIVFANHTCYQRIIQFPFSAIQNVLPFLPHPEKHRNIYWLHWATKDLVELNDYKGHWPEFMSKEFPLPPAALCEQFGEFIKPMVQLTYRLDKRNQNLRQSRELLLPKLISGEIDVSEPDINID